MARTDQWPAGTLEEIVEAGMDPARVSACTPHARDGSIRGCPCYATCIFHRKQFGGFRDRGPRNVGYYLKLSRGDGGAQKEDYMPCYRFVSTMQQRMFVALDRRNRGEDHETISIIAQEGQKIVVREYRTLAADGGNRSKDYRMTAEIKEIEVPRLVRPSENPLQTYEDQLRARAAARRDVELALEDLANERLGQQMAEVETPEAPVGRSLDIPTGPPPGEPLATPVATPVTKGRR